MALQIICSILVCCSCQACRAVLVNRNRASLRQDSLPVFSLNRCWASSAACNSFQATVQGTTSQSKPLKLMLEVKTSAKVTVLPACSVFQRHQKISVTASSRKCSSGIRSCCSTDWQHCQAYSHAVVQLRLTAMRSACPMAGHPPTCPNHWAGHLPTPFR